MKTFLSQLILACFVCLSLHSSITLAANNQILQTENLTPEIREELQKRFSEIEKNNITPIVLDQIIRYLMSKDIYELVEVYQLEDKSYTLELKPVRKINQVEFKGNNNLSETEISSVFNVKSGDRFDEETLVENANRIRQIYDNKGYINNQIDILYPQNPLGGIDVTIQINEGKQTRIVEILFLSNNETLNDKLNRELKSRHKVAYTEQALIEMKESARQFLRENRYIRANILEPQLTFNKDQSEVSVQFKLEAIERYNLEFENNIHFNDGRLEKALEINQFYTASPDVRPELINRLKKFYLSRGYARVQIEADEKQNELKKEQVKTIQFKIEEGPLVKIEDIQFLGQISENKNDLKEFIFENSGPLTEENLYHKDEIDVGIKKLVTDLQNRGYLQARVVSSRAPYNEKKDQVLITINLDMGAQSFTKGIHFEGNNSFPDQQLLEEVNLQVNQALKLNELEASILSLKKHYQENGFIEMSLLNENDSSLVEYNQTNTEAQIFFKIKEGPQVRVAAIVLEGNTYTKDFVILKELEFTKGDILTPQKLDESKNRLQQLGLFSNLDISMVESKTDIANRTIVVKVSERDPGVFNLGAGVSNERQLTLRGFTGLAYRNIGGSARAFSARLEGNYNIADIKFPETKITFGYLEPYLFDTRLRGRINLTRSQAVTDYDKKQVSEVNQVTYSIEQQINSHVLAVWDVYSIATVKDFRLDPNDPTPTTLQDIATTGPSIDIDYRDHPFNPTAGTFSRFNMEYGNPQMGSSAGIEFFKAGGSFTHYKSITEGWVFAHSIRSGYLKNLSQDGGVPYDKKGFVLGGRSTVRGFEAGTSERFPNDDDLGGEGFLLKTNATYFLLKSELRFPIYGSIGGAIFYDGGAVFIDGIDFDDPYRDSAGVALRIATPVGPVNFEFGFKLDRKEERDESLFRFHFSIGTF